MEAALDRKLAGVFEKLEELYFDIQNSRSRILGFTEFLSESDASLLQKSMQKCSNSEDYQGQYSRTNNHADLSNKQAKLQKKVEFEKVQDHFKHPVDFYITYNPNLKVSRTKNNYQFPSAQKSLEYSETERGGQNGNTKNGRGLGIADHPLKEGHFTRFNGPMSDSGKSQKQAKEQYRSDFKGDSPSKRVKNFDSKQFSASQQMYIDLQQIGSYQSPFLESNTKGFSLSNRDRVRVEDYQSPGLVYDDEDEQHSGFGTAAKSVKDNFRHKMMNSINSQIQFETIKFQSTSKKDPANQAHNSSVNQIDEVKEMTEQDVQTFDPFRGKQLPRTEHDSLQLGIDQMPVGQYVAAETNDQNDPQNPSKHHSDQEEEVEIKSFKKSGKISQSINLPKKTYTSLSDKSPPAKLVEYKNSYIIGDENHNSPDRTQTRSKASNQASPGRGDRDDYLRAIGTSPISSLKAEPLTQNVSPILVKKKAIINHESPKPKKRNIGNKSPYKESHIFSQYPENLGTTYHSQITEDGASQYVSRGKKSGISETPSMKFGKIEADMFSEELGGSDDLFGNGARRIQKKGSRSSSINNKQPFANKTRGPTIRNEDVGIEDEIYQDELEEQLMQYNQEKKMKKSPVKKQPKEFMKRAADVQEPNFGKLKGLFESPQKLLAKKNQNREGNDRRLMDDSMDSYGDFSNTGKISRQLSPPKKLERNNSKAKKGKSPPPKRIGAINTEDVLDDERWDLESNIQKMKTFSPNKISNNQKSPSIYLDESFSPQYKGLGNSTTNRILNQSNRVQSPDSPFSKGSGSKKSVSSKVIGSEIQYSQDRYSPAQRINLLKHGTTDNQKFETLPETAEQDKFYRKSSNNEISGSSKTRTISPYIEQLQKEALESYRHKQKLEKQKRDIADQRNSQSRVKVSVNPQIKPKKKSVSVKQQRTKPNQLDTSSILKYQETSFKQQQQLKKKMRNGGIYQKTGKDSITEDIKKQAKKMGVTPEYLQGMMEGQKLAMKDMGYQVDEHKWLKSRSQNFLCLISQVLIKKIRLRLSNTLVFSARSLMFKQKGKLPPILKRERKRKNRTIRCFTEQLPTEREPWRGKIPSQKNATSKMVVSLSIINLTVSRAKETILIGQEEWWKSSAPSLIV